MQYSKSGNGLSSSKSQLLAVADLLSKKISISSLLSANTKVITYSYVALIYS